VTARGRRTRVTYARVVVPYRSSECRIGSHRDCAQMNPAVSPVDIPVVYEACTCACHNSVSSAGGGR
jgi:hypothetical protein